MSEQPDFGVTERADIARQLRQSIMRRQRLSDRSAEEDAGGCECDELRAELAEVRRLLLPHPDEKAGEDAGCACDLHTAVTAAAWAAAEMRRMRDELAEQKAATEIQAALNGTLRAEIRRQMDDLAEMRRVNERVRDELAALQAGGDMVKHTGGERSE